MPSFTWIDIAMHYCISQSRRDFLRNVYCGFGSLALASMLRDEEARAGQAANPLAPRRPHLPDAKAKAVIFLFMSGGPSHLETFDPKPELRRLNGERLPESFGPVVTRRHVDRNRLLAPHCNFRKHGQSG